MTDTTNNEVLFNFSDPELGATVQYQTDDTDKLTKGIEEDFPKFLEKTGTVTTVYLKKDTDNVEYSPNAIAVLNANMNFLKKETLAYVANAVSTATAGSTFDGYSYNSVAMERDINQEVFLLHDEAHAYTRWSWHVITENLLHNDIEKYLEVRAPGIINTTLIRKITLMPERNPIKIDLD